MVSKVAPEKLRLVITKRKNDYFIMGKSGRCYLNQIL